MQSSSHTSFSVLMSVYNNDKAEFFHEALLSVYRQTYMPDEVILVVDGPVSNKIKSVIELFSSKYNSLNVIWLPENKGHGNAKRVGLQNCNNELIAVMDSDDICVLERFEKQINYFHKHSDVSIVGGTIAEFKNSIENLIGRRELGANHSEISTNLKLRCPMNHMTVMFKKSEVDRAGGYQDWYHNEDYYLWIRMFINGSKFANLKDILVYVRVDENFYLRRGGLKYFFSESRLQLFMYKNGVINLFQLFFNILIRSIIQLIMPNKVRGIIFRKLFRRT